MIISLNGLHNPFFFLYLKVLGLLKVLGGPTLYHTTTLKSSFALAARAKVLQGAPSRAVLTRTRSQSRELRPGATIEGAGSCALYHARTKMSIGAAKKFFLFFYIYTYVNYTTLSHFCQHISKIKKEKEDTTWYPLSLMEFSYVTSPRRFLIQPLQLPLRHEQLPQQPQLLHAQQPFQPSLHTLPRTLQLHPRD